MYTKWCMFVLLTTIMINNYLNVSGLCSVAETFVYCEDYEGKKPTSEVDLTHSADSLVDCLHLCLTAGINRSVFYESTATTCYCADKPPLSLGLTNQNGVTCMEIDGYTETWITSVIAVSSEYGAGADGRFLATQIIGQPDVYPRYGDIEGTWCPDVVDDNQWIEVGIQDPLYVDNLYIFETFNAGGVETISVRDTQGNWHVIWTTPGIQHIQNSRIFEPNFQPPNFKVDGIRLDVVMSVARAATGSDESSWTEYDAIRVIGRK